MKTDSPLGNNNEKDRASLPVLDNRVFDFSITSHPAFAHALQVVGPNNISILLAVCGAWLSLLSDSPVGLKPRSVLQRFLNELLEDPFQLIARLDSLALKLQKSLQRDEEGLIVIDDLFDQFRDTPIFREWHLFWKSRDPVILRYLLTFLTFAKKVEWLRPELETAAFREWSNLEARLGQLVNPPWVADLRAILRVLTDDWSDFAFYPKHGSGAVASRGIKGRVAKYEGMQVTDLMRSAYFTESVPVSRCLGVATFGDALANDTLSTIIFLAEDGAFVMSDPVLNWFPEPTLTRDPGMSRLAFVPKSYKSVRSICMEPIGHQFCQQAVLSWMTDNMKDGLLGSFIRLEDQAYNRVYAQEGSCEGLLDTIDLSSASDSVRWGLVRAVFPTFVLEHLHTTRSSTVQTPDGDIVHPHKFSPMGSAVCFPTQCLLYTAICILSAMYTYHGRDDLLVTHDFAARFIEHICYGTKGYPLPPRIYGDDIVCDNKTTSSLLSLLDQLGFSVNTDKSFTGTDAYRESCGGHYFDGHDVTFYQLKIKHHIRDLSIEAVGGVIDSANRAMEFGLKNVRNSLVRYALYTPIIGVTKQDGINPILFVEQTDKLTSFAVRSLQPHNLHLRRRSWLDARIKRKSTAYRFQREEVQSLHVVGTNVVEPPVHLDGWFYPLWWRDRRRASLTPETGGRYPGMKHLDDIPGSVYAADSLATGPGLRWTPT